MIVIFLGFALSDKWYIFQANVTYLFSTIKTTITIIPGSSYISHYGTSGKHRASQHPATDVLVSPWAPLGAARGVLSVLRVFFRVVCTHASVPVLYHGVPCVCVCNDKPRKDEIGGRSGPIDVINRLYSSTIVYKHLTLTPVVSLEVK